MSYSDKQTPCREDKKNSTLRLEIEFDAFVMIDSLLYRYCSFRPISPHNFKKVYIVKRCPLHIYIYSVRNSFNYPMWNVTINPYPMQIWCHHHVPQNCEAKQTISFTRLDGKKFTSRSGIYFDIKYNYLLPPMWILSILSPIGLKDFKMHLQGSNESTTYLERKTSSFI